MKYIEKLFKLKENGTDIKTELTAGLTTFFTMSYLFVLSPKILSSTGLNFNSVLAVTALFVFIGSVFMGLYANKPYAVAPFLGETAFLAYVIAPQFSIQGCFTAILICGIILFLMTIFNLREFIINQIPDSIKISFCTGLGLFFIFIALKDIGIVNFTTNSIPLEIGDFTFFPVLLGILSFILLIKLIHKGLKSAIIITVIITTISATLIGITNLPDKIFLLPDNITSSFFQFDFSLLHQKNFIPVLFVIFLIVNIDTSGALISLTYKENEKNRDTKDLKRPMLVDSLSVILAPIMGTTTPGAYIDSMTGISAGGKTGLTAVTVGILFLIGIFLAPIISIIPPCAYAPALLYIGILMTKVIKKLDFNDISEFAPALFTICTMIYTYNIGSGIIAGFAIYPIVKLVCGQKNKTNITLWILSALSILYFIIYNH